MKTRFFAPVLLLSGMTAFGNAAMASDELAGALLGAGAGAVIGHSIDRHDGAVVGGFLGAILGAAIADDDDRDYRRPGVRPYPYQGYGYPPAVVYRPPHPRYVPQPIFVQPRPSPYAWHQDRYEYRDGRRDRDNDRWHDGRRDRDNDRGRGGRDGHRGW